MRLYVTEEERPFLRDSLYETLSRVENDLGQAALDAPDPSFSTVSRLRAERKSILRLLTKIGEATEGRTS